MKILFTVITATFALLFCASCQKTQDIVKSSIVFTSMKETGTSELTLEATYTRGTYSYGAGFVYSTGEHPIVSSDGKNQGSIGLIISDTTLDEDHNKVVATFKPTRFTTETTYYIRAYICDIDPNDASYIYTYSSEEKSFTVYK